MKKEDYLIGLLVGALAAFVVWFFFFRPDGKKKDNIYENPGHTGYVFGAPRPGTTDVPGPTYEQLSSNWNVSVSPGQKRCVTFPCV